MVSYETLDVVYYSVRCAQATIGVFGNGLTMIAIIKYDFLKSATNVFIFSLALNDFQIGLMTPLAVATHYTRPSVTQGYIDNRTTMNTKDSNFPNLTNKGESLNQTWGRNTSMDGNNQQFEKVAFDPEYFAKWSRMCLAKEITNTLQSFGSIICIFLISVDRFIFIEKPLRYYGLMDIRKALFSCMSLWIVCVVVGPVLIPLYVHPEPAQPCDTSLWSSMYFYGIVTPLFTVLTVTNVILYIRIAYVAFSKSNSVAPATLSAQNQEFYKKVRKENKITKMLSIVLGLYVALYLPTVIFGSFGGESSLDILIVIKYISYMLWFTAMCVNPFIYVWKSKDFRKAFVLLLNI